jgi:hypothetical protein
MELDLGSSRNVGLSAVRGQKRRGKGDSTYLEAVISYFTAVSSPVRRAIVGVYGGPGDVPSNILDQGWRRLDEGSVVINFSYYGDRRFNRRW